MMDFIFKYLSFMFLLKFTYNVESSHVEYDYIIVGGGTAGCILASRLTENPKHTVLVLEAGISDLDYPIINVPLLTPYLQDTHIDWKFKTEPQKYAGKALNNKQVLWPQGKVLGGSSSHNYLDYIRGSRHDYDYWSELGNEGWSYDEVLPYFKKSINMRDERLADSEYHNVGGVWDIETPDAASNLLESLLQGSEEMGFVRADVNGKEQAFSLAQHNTRHGRRLSTAAAFLRPAMTRENLHVITEAYVTQIIIDNKVATGVTYVKDGEEHIVFAKQEVIVSAGTLMSPKILMLSGIGPKEHLESFGIEVIADLPVGNYVNDHPALMNAYSVNASVSVLPENFLSFESAFNYNVYGKGDLASSTLEGNGFFSLPTKPAEQKYPDIQWALFTVIPGNSDESSKTMKKSFGFNSSYWDEFYQHQRGKSGYTVSAVLLHPRTNGTVRLRSTDPFDTPIYRLDYFEHPDDVKDMIQSIRLQQKLLETDAMRSLGAVDECPHHSGCKEHTFDTDEYWECFIKYNMFSCYHYTSSCRMANDSTGVVDNKLRVKGISRLRVVDASVMPFVPSGNTMTPTVMIAEKAADMIKQDAK